MEIIKPKLFFSVLTAIFLVEGLSLAGFFWPPVTTIAFWLVIIVTAMVSYKNLFWGYLAALAELTIGSKGHLLEANIFNFSVSLRLGIFIVLILAWTSKWLYARFVKKTKPIFLPEYLQLWFWLFVLVLIWGVFNAWQKGNPLTDIFLDANGYLYLGLLPVAFFAWREKAQIKNLLNVFLAGTLACTLKSFFFLFIFSHSLMSILPNLYRWVRVTGIAEIADLAGGFYRVFFQSHIYNVSAVLILLGLIWWVAPKLKRPEKTVLYLLLLANLAIVILGFSRSFWLAFLVAFCLVFLIALVQKIKFKLIAKKFVSLGGIFLLSVLLITIITKFPWPTPKETTSVFSALEERVSDLSGEAAARSRWNLIPPLWQNIKQAPILGLGFGAKTTFTTPDPRYLAINPSGQLSTYSLEWAYLDIIVEMGAIGLLVILIFAGKIVWRGYKNLIKNNDNFSQAVIFGLLTSLIIVLTTHFFTPYLNHPLGLGILIAATVVFEISGQNDVLPR